MTTPPSFIGLFGFGKDHNLYASLSFTTNTYAWTSAHSSEFFLDFLLTLTLSIRQSPLTVLVDLSDLIKRSNNGPGFELPPPITLNFHIKFTFDDSSDLHSWRGCSLTRRNTFPNLANIHNSTSSSSCECRSSTRGF